MRFNHPNTWYKIPAEPRPHTNYQLSPSSSFHAVTFIFLQPVKGAVNIHYLSHSYITYSMGRIIKLVCVRQCVCLRALSRSHFLIDFHQNWHSRKNPQRKNEFVRGQYRITSSPILPHKTPIFGQEVLKPQANIKWSYICLKCTRIAEIFAS